MLSPDKIKLKSKIFFHFFRSIAKELNEVNYAVVKGESLSFYMYGEWGKRYYNDIDLLVSLQDLKYVKNVLEKNGFVPISSNISQQKFCLIYSHQIIPYVKRIGNFNIYIDVNFDIFWGEYEGVRLDLDTFLSDAVEIDIYGIKTKVLPPIKALIQLVLHHYKDMNSLFLLATRNSITYDMFKDVYHLLKNNTDRILLDELYKMSCEYSIVPYVYYILYYTGQIYDDPLIKKYVDAFETPYGRELLNCYGLCEREKKEWRFDFKTRLETENLYDLIKKDLSEKDIEKISINKQFF